MPLLRRALEATASGLLVALMAPPCAAAAFALIMALSAITPWQAFDSSPGDIFLLALGVTTGAYLIGVIPAFLAGLVLPTLRQLFRPTIAAAATGLIGTAVYAATFGSHLLSWPHATDLIRTHALPAFIGVSVAAVLATLIERRHAEA